MKHKYKINIDQPLPSEDKISAHKDFGRILADYHNLTEPIYRRPLYKNPKAFMGLVFIVTVALLVFWAVEKEEKDQKKDAELKELPAEIKMAAENSFLRTPVKGLEILPITFKTNLAKPQKVQLPNGLTLSVPAGAFENAQGEPAIGEVEISVRTVSQPAELIAMGIPMQSENRLVSPTKVLEIKASQGNVPLVLRAGQQIEVEQLVDPASSHAQSIFTLDEPTRIWVGGENTVVQPTLRKQNVASIGQEDGFGVIQFDEKGQAIPQVHRSNDGAKEIKVLHFSLDKLGIACIGESSGLSASLAQYKVRFTDKNGEPLRLLTLYSLPKGLNTVQFFYPKTADFVFEPSVLAGTTINFAGFLPDGRLAYSKEIGTLMDTVPVHVLQMEITPAPIKDLQELTQLIDQLAGPLM